MDDKILNYDKKPLFRIRSTPLGLLPGVLVFLLIIFLLLLLRIFFILITPNGASSLGEWVVDVTLLDAVINQEVFILDLITYALIALVLLLLLIYFGNYFFNIRPSEWYVYEDRVMVKEGFLSQANKPIYFATFLGQIWGVADKQLTFKFAKLLGVDFGRLQIHPPEEYLNKDGSHPEVIEIRMVKNHEKKAEIIRNAIEQYREKTGSNPVLVSERD